MAQEPPNIDNTPLDPGGQAPGLVNSIGAHIDILEKTTPLAPFKANIIIPHSEDFLPSLRINFKELFSPLDSNPPL
jgi:hypothetical protein